MTDSIIAFLWPETIDTESSSCISPLRLTHNMATKPKKPASDAPRAPRVRHNITGEQIVKTCYEIQNIREAAKVLGVPITTLGARIRTLKKNGVPFPEFTKARNDYTALKALAESLAKPVSPLATEEVPQESA